MPESMSLQLVLLVPVVLCRRKDGKSLQIVHSLEPLNRVTIKHAGVTPFTDQIGEHFAGRA